MRPDFLAYGSRFIRHAHGPLSIGRDGHRARELCDHRNFQHARELVEQKSSNYFARAQVTIGETLGPLFVEREQDSCNGYQRPSAEQISSTCS